MILYKCMYTFMHAFVYLYIYVVREGKSMMERQRGDNRTKRTLFKHGISSTHTLSHTKAVHKLIYKKK